MLTRLIIKNLQTICLIIMSLALVSCQDTIPNRSLIGSGSIGGETAGAGGGNTATRPDGAVKFKADFCACKDGVAVSYGNCAATCAGKVTNGAELLYANFTVTEAISMDATFKNLDGWCNTPLNDDSEEANPTCVLNAKDENNQVIQLAEVKKGALANSLTVDISELDENKTYVLTLLQTSSGSKSDSVQMIKYSVDTPISNLGPLKNAPISQYSCITRSTSTSQNGDIYYDAAFRVHFYFLPSMPPDPIAPNSNIVCHDWLNPLYTVIDNALYPRLELIPGTFNLWDNTDPRFYDNNGNDQLDVNDVIIQKAKNFGATNIPAGTQFFAEFPVLSSIPAEDAGSTGATARSMGYYMYPWIDQTTFKSYCLNASHYNSSNPLFKAMRDVVGVDMEGIYVGVKSPESVNVNGTLVSAPTDFILIREAEVKSVWFYMNNGVPTYPQDSIVSSKAVYFYYPINPASPYVRTSNQKLYQVKGASELNNTSVRDNTSYPPHDRKIGCIPKF